MQPGPRSQDSPVATYPQENQPRLRRSAKCGLGNLITGTLLWPVPCPAMRTPKSACLP